MPKLKTKKGAAKRFKFTKKKKLKYAAINKGHLLSKKTAKRKRQLRRAAYVEGKNVKYLRRLLPYG